MKGNVFKATFAVFVACSLVLTGCKAGEKNTHSHTENNIRVVTTTTMLADMVEQIGKETVSVTSLMGPGVDAHLYKATPGDYSMMDEADLIVYNGLNLEGKLATVIEHLKEEGKNVVNISENIAVEKLIEDSGECYHNHDEEEHNHSDETCESCEAHVHSHDEEGQEHDCSECTDHSCEECESCHDHEHEGECCEGHHHDEEGHVHGEYDSHIWFDAMIWKEASENLYKELVRIAPENESMYKANYEEFTKSLDEIHSYAISQISSIPKESRVLVTAHHAFSYFGKAYGIEVKGLQGISTTSESGTKDVSELADFIAERKIKAIFVESNVPIKSIEALQEAVKSRGFDVKIGGELFSDSLGSDEETKTYVGAMKSNVDTIVSALK